MWQVRVLVGDSGVCHSLIVSLAVREMSSISVLISLSLLVEFTQRNSWRWNAAAQAAGGIKNTGHMIQVSP